MLSTYRAYDTNRATFENLLQLEPVSTPATFIIVNPMHHTNSTAITDWALRRPHARLHLCLRYSTKHWSTMETVYKQAMAEDANTRIIAPMVSRHFDFLESLVQGGSLPVPPDQMKAVLEKLDILIGSAPVGSFRSVMLGDRHHDCSFVTCDRPDNCKTASNVRRLPSSCALRFD